MDILIIFITLIFFILIGLLFFTYYRLRPYFYHSYIEVNNSLNEEDIEKIKKYLKSFGFKILFIGIVIFIIFHVLFVIIPININIGTRIMNYLLMTISFIVLYLFLILLYKYFIDVYSIVLGMNKKEFEDIEMYTSKFKPTCLLSKNTVYIFMFVRFIEIDVKDIKSVSVDNISNFISYNFYKTIIINKNSVSFNYKSSLKDKCLYVENWIRRKGI